ncbi:MAG: SDR family NAD(P)-dependent oxidoreductase [Methanobacteriota archaeon]|nr:MAG: SDR family NAD(P)-dependent oxidoreductase [Euryarchaeota archaeon]
MKKENWTQEKIPSQKGRVAIVTGASSGIGYETARILANKGAHVILAVRNPEKGERALERIKLQNANARVRVMVLDLANLASVREFAEEFKRRFERLDLLINNAGVMIPPYSKTADGFELQFGTNHLGHFALTGLLLDLLINTPGSRIVNVASMAHKYGNLNFDDLNWEKRPYKAWRAYGDSKLANLYFTYHLAEKLNAAGVDVKVTAAHPGWTATDLQRHSGVFQLGNKLFAQSAEMGALPTLRAATDPDARSGDYYGPDGFQEWRGYPVKVQSNQLSHDREIARRLWEVSEKLTGVKYTLSSEQPLEV